MNLRALLSLFGCSHSDYSWPHRQGLKHYVICWDCKREIEYDWERMEIVSESPTIKERAVKDILRSAID